MIHPRDFGIPHVSSGYVFKEGSMSRALDLFLSIHGLPQHGDTATLQTLSEAAAEWRRVGRFFGAGYCMSFAEAAAAGTPQWKEAINQAIGDYKKSLSAESPDSIEGYSAIVKWMAELHYFEHSASIPAARSLQQELAQRLITYYGDSKNADSFLVRGFVANVDLDGGWEPSFPDHETTGGTFETRLQGRVSISIPSAFQLYISLGDYKQAQSIPERYPEAFSTPGLRGWKLAIRGFLQPGEAADSFAAAANEFAQDVFKEDKVPWSSINVDLWAKYFRARALLARISGEPTRASELLRQSSHELESTKAGWVNPQVWRFRVLVNILLQTVNPEHGFTPEQARNELATQTRLFGEHELDSSISEFNNASAEAFKEFRTDPSLALRSGRLYHALQILGRIPLIGPPETEALASLISDRAHSEILGPERTLDSPNT
jgi:hypothetical protein